MALPISRLFYHSNTVSNAQEWETRHESYPKDDIPNRLVAPHPPHLTQRDHRQLRHLHEEQVRAYLLRHDGHDELVA